MDQSRSFRSRSRSRSPDLPNDPVKLHISNLPVGFAQQQLSEIFQKFGAVQDVRIIRKGANGQPLRESCYGFVVMRNRDEALKAIEEMKSSPWTVDLSREARQKQVTKPAPPPPAPPAPMPIAFRDNVQATQIMLIHNANQTPEQDQIIELIRQNHPNAYNVSGVPADFQNCFLTREVWIANISPVTDKKLLYDGFKEFGPIESIEMFSSKGFAFIKYLKVISATLAYERGQGLLIDGRPVKVAFADPTRRYDTLGDSKCQEDPNFNPSDDSNFKSLYLGYSAGKTAPSERVIFDICSKYGKVKGVFVKRSQPSYAFVDFDTGEQAARARRELYTEDKNGVRRAELGDASIEVSFKNTHNVKKPQQKIDVNDLAKKLVQQKSSDFLSNLYKLPQQPGSVPMPAAKLPPPKPVGQPQKKYDYSLITMSPAISGNYYAPVPGYWPPQGYPMPQYMQMGMVPQQFAMYRPPEQYLNYPPPTDQSSSPPPVQPVTQTVSTVTTEPEQRKEQGLDVVWSGFMSRTKKPRVGVDAILLSGSESCIPANLHHLSISHRVPWSELMKHKALALMALEASNETYQESFNEYARYFAEKERAGYIMLKNLIVYLVPPGPQADRLTERLGETQMLAVFVDPEDKSGAAPA